MGFKTGIAAAYAALLISAFAGAQTWQPLNHPASFTASVALLLTDGSVLCQNESATDWWKLVPDNKGSYVNGSWVRVADAPNGYAPESYASAVLADGRVLVMGGEEQAGVNVWQTTGYIYDPDANTWTFLPPPPGWAKMGDCPCAVLPNGNFLIGHPFSTQVAILNTGAPGNPPLAWTIIPGTDKDDRNAEEGWALLPDGSILTVDILAAPKTQRLLPDLGQWVSAGSTPSIIADQHIQEVGPSVLMADGRVICFGATAHSAIYTPSPQGGSWAAAPDFPLDEMGRQTMIFDGPACLLPSGHAFFATSASFPFKAGTHYFEFDGTSFLPTADHPNHLNQGTAYLGMLMLPTGQVLVTEDDGDIEIYTPAGAPKDSWRPRLNTNPLFVAAGLTYQLTGWQFNGLSQCSAFGDELSNATNYPLVRLTNMQTGDVRYLKTFGHSTMAVATGNQLVSTNFRVPLNMKLGPSKLEVVVNGIASRPAFIDVGVKRRSISP